MQKRRLTVGVLWAAFSAMTAACGGGSGGSGSIAGQPDSCTVVDQNAFVQDIMLDVYLWADDVVPVDPASVASPQEMLDDDARKEQRWLRWQAGRHAMREAFGDGVSSSGEEVLSWIKSSREDLA